MQIPPVNKNEYGEDDEHKYKELYKNKENEIKEHIKNNFSKLIFLVDFPEDTIDSECGIGKITDIKVNLPIDISDVLLDVPTFDTNQVLVKFRLKAKVNYTARLYYMKYHDINKLEKDFFNSIEVNVEVMFTLTKDNSFFNPIIKMEPTTAAFNFE
jgi:hypothetical protein